MFKKTFIPILLLFLSSCGYEAIYSAKNLIDYNFSISELTFDGDRNVNIKIKQKINNYTLDTKDKNYVLKISSDTKRVVIAKDAAGDPTSYKSTITVNIEGNFQNNFQIVESFDYNNDVDKFNLKKYEKEIINNLAETAAEKILYKLSKIQ